MFTTRQSPLQTKYYILSYPHENYNKFSGLWNRGNQLQGDRLDHDEAINSYPNVGLPSFGKEFHYSCMYRNKPESHFQFYLHIEVLWNLY